MSNKKPRLIIEDGTIKNQDGNVIGAILEDATPEDISAIEASYELKDAVKEFIDEPSKLRSAVKRFENVLEKHEL